MSRKLEEIRALPHHRIAVGDHLFELLQETVLDRKRRSQVVQLGDPYGRGLAHVGVVVAEALAQRVADVVEDLVGPETAHCANCKRPDQRIAVFGVLRTAAMSMLLRSAQPPWLTLTKVF